MMNEEYYQLSELALPDRGDDYIDEFRKSTSELMNFVNMTEEEGTAPLSSLGVPAGGPMMDPAMIPPQMLRPEPQPMPTAQPMGLDEYGQPLQ